METATTNNSFRDQQPGDTDSRYRAPLVTIGYIILMASFSIYAMVENFGYKENLFLIFWLHYILNAVYAGLLIIDGSIGVRKSWKKENIDKTVITINLFLISAYALNRELSVFENSTDWLCSYILISSITLLSFRYFTRLPGWVNDLQYLFLGCAITFYAYLALYVANYYVFGAVGILALGIGAHILVPLFLVTACVCLFLQNHRSKKSNLLLGIGIMIPLSMAVAFALEWNSRVSKIETLANQSVMYGTEELPTWVTLGETIENDWISQRILKSDLVYTTASDNFSDWNFIPKNMSWDEIQRHDPLVYIASLFAKTTISEDDRIKILKAISNGRHLSNERLWSGDNLTTSYVVSDVDIYTDLRLAYTEQYLNVKNNALHGGWRRNTEEGIYTFYLPEGSIVTSLSLWINGKEQKGILTSKQKATKAYTTIVGVEQRDPSVIHWQEGNTVTVRVFPCTPLEERKFKIGITSPLQVVNGETIYKNILFDGPSAEDARETRRIRFIGTSKNIEPGDAFKRDKNNDFVAERKYDPDLKLAFKTVPLAPNHFTFGEFTYSMSDYVPRQKAVTFSKIFLDINNSWTEDELSDLKLLVATYPLYVYPEKQPVQLDTENWDEITSEMIRQNFSLFPFHHINDPANTLVVTKGKVLSPHLSDFSDSKFAENINKFFATGNKINVFNLEGISSTYINSFKELRGLEFTTGKTSDLINILESKTFPKSDESEERIIIHNADIVITKSNVDSTNIVNNAPDHLARLFTYNNIMRKAGAHYFNHDFVNDELVDEAATAYVVSPVSSLIVLETQEDYKRFDIQDKENSLHNAVKQSSGAVPEPHEWALIILFALFILYLKFKS